MRRAFTFSEPTQPQEVKPGADWAATQPVQPEYDTDDALSAFAAFVWVRACVDAIGADLASLPLVAYRGKGATAVRLDGHPALDLLDYPTTDMGRELWERQLLLYWLLPGNAYALMVGGAQPTSLVLLHPDRVKPVNNEWGGVAAYRFGSEQMIDYRPEDVLHVRGPSWRSGPVSLLGEGLIRTLHNDLTADLAAQKLNTAHAQRGRPTAIVSPTDDNIWDDDVRKAILGSFNKQTEKGGTLVVGQGVKVELPTFTARDLEFSEQRVFTRQGILAAFGVPPVRLGLETANYATANQQMKTYWETRRADARLLDAQLTRVARRWDKGVTIAHDFSGVEALQESRSSRLERVMAWHTLGASAADAAAYEGFTDAPVEDIEEPGNETTPDASGTETQSFARSNILFLTRAPLVVPRDEDGRLALWKSLILDVQGPSERALNRDIGAALRSQRARLIKRLDGVRAVKRDLLDDLMATIWPEAEDSVLASAAERDLEIALRRSFDSAALQVGQILSYDPSAIDASLQVGLSNLKGASAVTTRKAVAAVIADELARGGTIANMQSRLQVLPQFNPARALMVARTEATRATSAGSDDAYIAAVGEGVALRKEWLSARDSHVRDAHMLLDGQERQVGEYFVVPPLSPVGPGQRARYPGDFDLAALVVNCRCTTIPVVEEAA